MAKKIVKKLYCFSRIEKEKYLSLHGWNETLPEGCVSIEVVNPGETPLLKESENVLNLCFDDISEEEHGLQLMSEEDASRCFKFIEENKDKDFFINCSAGRSRSQGIVRFILDCYEETDWEVRLDNLCVTPNLYVTAMLKRKYYEQKHIL